MIDDSVGLTCSNFYRKNYILYFHFYILLLCIFFCQVFFIGTSLFFLLTNFISSISTSSVLFFFASNVTKICNHLPRLSTTALVTYCQVCSSLFCKHKILSRSESCLQACFFSMEPASCRLSLPTHRCWVHCIAHGLPTPSQPCCRWNNSMGTSFEGTSSSTPIFFEFHFSAQCN